MKSGLKNTALKLSDPLPGTFLCVSPGHCPALTYEVASECSSLTEALAKAAAPSSDVSLLEHPVGLLLPQCYGLERRVFANIASATLHTMAGHLLFPLPLPLPLPSPRLISPFSLPFVPFLLLYPWAIWNILGMFSGSYDALGFIPDSGICPRRHT